MTTKTPLKVVNELLDNNENKPPLGDEQKVMSIVQQLNAILRKVQDSIHAKEVVDTTLPETQKEKEKEKESDDTSSKPQTTPQTKGDMLGDHVKITRYGKNEKDELSLETTQDVYVPAYIRRK